MRGAMPNEESVLLLMEKTAMDKKSYLRQVQRIDLDTTLFRKRRHRIRATESGSVIIECKDGKYEPLGDEDILK